MRVSSATASLDAHEPTSRTGYGFDASQIYLWPQVKRYFNKLDRLMTAIAHAEAGNLDAVQKILDENKPIKKPECSRVGSGRIEWR